MSGQFTLETLGTWLQFRNGKKSPERSANFTIPVYGSNGIIGFSEEANVSGPTTIVGRVGSYCGSTYFSEGDCWVTDNAIIAESFDASEARYWYYVLASLNLNTFSHGSGQPLLNQTILKSIEFSPQSPKTRAGIARLLGALDDKIESNQRQIDLSSDLVDQFAISWSSDIEWCAFSDLALQRKVSVNPSKIENQEVALLSIPAYDDEKTPEVVNSTSIMSNKLLVDKESILVSRLNPRFFRSWYFTPREDIMALASTEFMVLTAVSGLEDEMAALWLAIRHPAFHDEMLNRVTGTSGSHQRVRPDDVLSIEVPNFSALPTEKKGKVSALLRRGEQLRRENLTLKSLRDSLLPELLSGRITPEQLEAGL